MATCFKKVLQGLDVREDAQGSGVEQSFVYVLLTELDTRETANGTGDVLTNPYAETLRRLSAYSSTFAYKRLAALIGMRAN